MCAKSHVELRFSVRRVQLFHANEATTAVDYRASEYVFTVARDHRRPLTANTLATQHRRMVALGIFKPDAGLHALRHTYLTECGKYTDNVKALQRLAGHSRIETTARYLHPDQREMDRIASIAQRAREERAAEALRQDSAPAISPVN